MRTSTLDLFQRDASCSELSVLIRSPPLACSAWPARQPFLNLRWLRFSLNQRESCALRILEDRETTDSRDVIGRFHYRSPQFSRFLYLCIAVVDGEIHEPMRREPGHFRSYLKH